MYEALSIDLIFRVPRPVTGCKRNSDAHRSGISTDDGNGTIGRQDARGKHMVGVNRVVAAQVSLVIDL